MRIFRWLKTGAKFTRQNPSILYSLTLILIIPAFLFINSYYIITSFQDNINKTLQTKATLVEDVIVKLIANKISDTDYLEKKINEIQKDNPEIKDLKIYAFKEDYFKLAAGTEEERKGMPLSDEKALAWVHDEGIAHLTQKEGQRYWNVIKPFQNSDGKKVGLISMSLSLAKTDNLIQNTVNYSYIILILTLIVVLGLVIQHTRLFEYANLFKKLKEVDEMKDNFISIAAHELRTPLTAISGYASVLKEKLFKNLSGEDKEDLNRIIISAKRLDKLVEDILNVSRIEQNRLSFENKKCDISQITKETAEELKPQAEDKKLKFKINIAEKPIHINGDKQRLKQILINLIGNSIKYTPQGHIDIKLTAKDEKAIIDIQDTGLGMSPKEQKQLFTKFYRVKNKQTLDISGTGLGLWITKRLVEKMNGKIEVQSIKGTGSKFTIKFPLTQNKDQKSTSVS